MQRYVWRCFQLHSSNICSTFYAVNEPHFILNGKKYLNNSEVKLQDVGAGDHALRCHTTSSNCCRDERIGEFYYPGNTGTAVGINSNGEPFYRNRRDSEILLNRRPQSTSPLGRFRCEIVDGCDENVSIYITLGKFLIGRKLYSFAICNLSLIFRGSL